MKLIVGIIVVSLGILCYYCLCHWISKMPLKRAEIVTAIIYVIAGLVLTICYFDYYF